MEKRNEQKMKHLFHITGKKGAGKSTLLKWLGSEFPTTEVRFHLEEHIAKGIFDSSMIPNCFFWTSEMLAPCLKTICKYDIVFITGLYHQSELDFFSQEFHTHSIAVVSSDDHRWDRIISRQRKGGETISHKELLFKDAKRDGSAEGYHKSDINALITSSEYRLSNDGSLEQFRQSYLKLRDYLRQQYHI